jgi:hypothetical protein
MGTDIYGWVEAVTHHHEGAPVWRPVIDLEMAGAVHRDYRVFERIFGVTTPLGGPVEHAPGFRRGLPHDTSDQVQRDAEDRWTDDHSHTWVSAEEFLGTDWLAVAPFPSPWTRMVALMRLLVQAHGMDRLRLVVWFRG